MIKQISDKAHLQILKNTLLYSGYGVQNKKLAG
jgi:hypothetical protein